MKKNSSGITLIALVITIIVMLILAGVSLNALVGDNGILKQAQYASFLSEMSAVEEAVQLWKVNQEGNAIPAKGIVQSPEIDKSERIGGEVGYYRVWSTTQTMPSDSIMLDANTFNNKFGGELVYYPGGIEDLYYLDNEGLDLKTNKKYLIDAVNSMVYSVNGIMLNGVRCYSLEMAKAVMSGTYDMPQFAEAEVSGSQANGGKVAAGNTEPEFLEDGSPNPNYNPNGFQIIADESNKNIYKLYNNGDLYGKGVKGTLLNTNPSEYSINKTLWNELKIPDSIPGASEGNVKVCSGRSAIYVIDKNNDLWAWGLNTDNRFGLTKEQQENYVAYTPIKLDINGKKVHKVIPTYNNTYVITQDDKGYELYVAGNNQYGSVGVDSDLNTFDEFKYVDFENPENIICISGGLYTQGKITLILVKKGNENKLYYSGYSSWSILKDSEFYNKKSKKFIEIFNGTLGEKLNFNIDYLYTGNPSETRFYFIAQEKLYLFDGSKVTEQKFGEKEGKVLNFSSGALISIVELSVENRREIWYYNDSPNNLTGASENVKGKWTRLDTDIKFPEEITNSGIKDITITCSYAQNFSSIYYILNNGSVYVSGSLEGTGTGNSEKFLCMDHIEKISSLEDIKEISNADESQDVMETGAVILASENKYYMTWLDFIFAGKDILENAWVPVANNVKKFNGKSTSCSDSLAYIDKEGDIWVAGLSPMTIGLGKKETESIKQFTLLKDYYKNSDPELYDSLDKKIIDYQFAFETMLILTNEGKLFVCGKDTVNDGWNVIGLGKGIDAYKPTQILGNDNEIGKVKSILGSYCEKFFVTEEGDLYCFGRNSSTHLPEKVPEVKFQSNSVLKMTSRRDYGATIIENYKVEGKTKQKIWINYSSNEDFNFGIPNKKSNGWSEYDFSTIIGEDKVKDFIPSYGALLVITENGKLFVTGDKRSIGLNTTNKEILKDLTLIETENLIVGACGGYGEIGNKGTFFTFYDDKGNVYGTGFNGNGVLGRWKGGTRGAPNTRYRTAFEWVECPELEI